MMIHYLGRSALGCCLWLGLVSPGLAQQRLATARDGSHLLPVLERPARLSVTKVLLTDALAQLTRQSGVVVAFSPSLVTEQSSRVSCACVNSTVGQALESMLGSTGFDYAVVREQVVLFMRIPSRAPEPILSLRSALAVQPAQLPMGRAEFSLEAEQQRIISGVVVTDRGGPIAGATVVLGGSTASAATDRDGRFRLQTAATGDVTIRVTAIGYRPLTQIVRAGSELRLVLNDAPINLDELIVTGTPGGTEKRALGNSIAEIDAASVVETAPVANLGQLLNGRVAGVSVQTATGIIGSGPRINVRGQASLVFAGEPLLYVDGVRMDNAPSTGPATAGARVISRFNDINPNDIERIEILKGPAASTLYGTEASNGVIQVITKQGRASERAEITTTVRQGANWFMDPEGRWPTWYGRDATTGQIVSRNHALEESRRGTPLFRTGHLQGYGLNVSGGSDLLRYYAASEYDQDEGIEPTNQAERFHGRANLSFSPRKSLKLNANTGFILSQTNLSREEGTSVMASALSFNPARLSTTRGFNLPPEVIWEAFDLGQAVRRFTGGLQAQHAPATWFTQRLTAGVDFLDEENSVLIPFMRSEIAAFFDPTTASGARQVDRRVVLNTTLDYAATVSAKLFGSLQSSTSVGGQYYRKAIKLNSLSGTTFPAPGVTTVGGATIRSATEDFIENVTIGTYAQEQLSWRDRFYLTAALRADDNSAFGTNFDLVTYPKISASWVISEEPFFRKLSVVNVLKLRAAFGGSGQQPDNFASLRTFQPVVGPGGVAAVTPQLLGNPDLKPERGEELEVGFEASLLNQRVGIDFTYFNQTTKDAILLRDVAFSTGFPGQQFVNIGKVRNRGMELLIKTLAMDTKAVDLDLTFNVATNKNEILELGLPNAAFLTGGIAGTLRKQPGYPIQAIFTRRVVSAALDANGLPVNVLCDGGPGAAPVPCATAPRVFIGQVTPRVEGSISSTVTVLDRLRISALVDFKTGYRRFDNTTQFAPCSASRICEENFFPERFDPKRIAEIQGGIDYSWVYPVADFAKLREVSVNYVLPRSWSRMLRARQGSLTLAARNLHTWTNHPSLDPETVLIGSVNPNGNQADQAITPIPASIMLTVNLVF